MKIFVATKETQGQRKNDFCHADEGEAVAFNAITCTGETADGECGYARSLSGLRTGKGTTTMKVAEMYQNVGDLEYVISRSMGEWGWLTPPYDQLVDSTGWAKRLVQEAARFPVGTVVEYRDGEFVAR